MGESPSGGVGSGIAATFSAPQRQVYVWSYPIVLPDNGLGNVIADAPYLKAFDANGILLGEVFYPRTVLSAPNPGWQQLVFVSNSPNIASVRMSCTINQGGLPVVGYFDDFAFFA